MLGCAAAGLFVMVHRLVLVKPLGSVASDLLQNMITDCRGQYGMAMSSAIEITDAFMGHAGGCNELSSVRKGNSTQQLQEAQELLESLQAWQAGPGKVCMLAWPLNSMVHAGSCHEGS